MNHLQQPYVSWQPNPLHEYIVATRLLEQRRFCSKENLSTPSVDVSKSVGNLEAVSTTPFVLQPRTSIIMYNKSTLVILLPMDSEIRLIMY